MEHNQGLPTPEGIAAIALALFGVIAAAVTCVAVVESYSNLLAFALAHGLHGWRAAIAPGAVDSFIVMGELLLFTALLLGWTSGLATGLGFGMAAWGFLLSVGGNVWHAASASPVDRAVAAIWPVTATAGLAGGLIIVKQVMSRVKAPGAAAVAADPGKPPPVSEALGREPDLAAARPVTRVRQLDDTERFMIRHLVAGGHPLPGRNELSRDPALAHLGSDATRKRYARKFLDGALAELERRDGHVNGSSG